MLLSHIIDLITAVVVLGTAIYTAKRINTVQSDVRKVELATNSMKDALVKATGEAAFAAGEKSERANPERDRTS